jgi:hypothetical protein
MSLVAFLDRINFYGMRFNIDGKVVQADGLIALQVLLSLYSIFS